MLTDEQTRHLIALWKHRRSSLEKQIGGTTNSHEEDPDIRKAVRSCIDELTLVISDIEHQVERNKRIYPDEPRR